MNNVYRWPETGGESYEMKIIMLGAGITFSFKKTQNFFSQQNISSDLINS